jgi:hypothetical protein
MSFRHSAQETTQRRDPVQDFADRIIAELEKGVKPWVRPWDPEKAGGPQSPFNPATQHSYRGINVLILGMDMRAFTNRRSALDDVSSGPGEGLASEEWRKKRNDLLYKIAQGRRRKSGVRR